MSEEIKEVHIKTYDEWLKYYENATKEQIIEDLTRDVKYFADAVKDIKELQNKLQQKENIIKEVRKKLVNLNDKFKTISGIPFNVSEIVEMIEMLDKEVN